MKHILLMIAWVLLSTSHAQDIITTHTSPIVGYDRVIHADASVFYKQQNGKHLFSTSRLVDLDNIYHKGAIDNYDDPYITDILKAFKLIKTIHHKTPQATLNIVFKSAEKASTFDLKRFDDTNLSINLYVYKGKASLPLNLEVYPFFIINHRFIQGIITPKLLQSLIAQSNYSQPKQKVSLQQLKQKLTRIFPTILPKVTIEYSMKLGLFVVKNKKGTVVSYISKDGRYILEYPRSNE